MTALGPTKIWQKLVGQVITIMETIGSALGMPAGAATLCWKRNPCYHCPNPGNYAARRGALEDARSPVFFAGPPSYHVPLWRTPALKSCDSSRSGPSVPGQDRRVRGKQGAVVNWELAATDAGKSVHGTISI